MADVAAFKNKLNVVAEEKAELELYRELGTVEELSLLKPMSEAVDAWLSEECEECEAPATDEFEEKVEASFVEAAEAV